MGNIVLTISIAAYNVADSIVETLKSLVVSEQYRPLIEVLIVNDGSKDNTCEVAEKFCSNHSDYMHLINKENGGYGSTINTSFNVAKGKYYKQLDAGDTYNTENLERFLDYLANCDADIVITPYEKYFVNTKSAKLEDVHRNIKSAKQDITQVDPGEDILMHEMAFRIDLMRGKEFFITEHCFYTDNEYTFLPLMEAKTISRFELPIYRYYLGVEGQSVSVQGMQKHYKDTVLVAFKLYRIYTEKQTELNSRGALKDLIERKIRKITDIMYSSYMLVGEKGKKTLLSLDKKIREEYPSVYILNSSVKKIKVLQKTKFHFYNFQCNIVLRKMR